MKVLFVMNGISNGFSGKPNISGGDVMAIEIAKRWAQKGVEVHFLTPMAGKDLCERLGLQAVYHLSYSSNNPSIWRYIFQTIKSAVSLSIFTKKIGFDIVYSTCEHLYDVLPAFRMSRRNVKWVAKVHFVPPPPWTRPKAGRLNAFFYYLNHLTGAYIIRKNAGLVFAVSQRTASDYVCKLKFDKNKVVTIPGGVDHNSIRNIAIYTNKMQYDAVFMKRLQPMKGVFDVIEVWSQVVSARPKAKLLIVGDGPIDVVKRMRRLISKHKLSENIEMLGPIYEFKEKILLLAKSRLFLLPSYEENWAIVIGEALAVGLPVVAYDLPEIKPIWGEHVRWIPHGDMKSFAKEVVKLLSNEEYYRTHVGKGITFMKQFDWGTIAKKELETCTQSFSMKSDFKKDSFQARKM